jgi:hypothetical protein
VVIHQQPSHQQPISSTVSTHHQGYKWTFYRHPTHLQGQLINSLYEARLSGATFGLVAPALFLLDPTVRLDGARPANTYLYPALLLFNGARALRGVPREPRWSRWYITTLKLIGGHYLMPDSREGGQDTGAGRSSSI